MDRTFALRITIIAIDLLILGLVTYFFYVGDIQVTAFVPSLAVLIITLAIGSLKSSFSSLERNPKGLALINDKELRDETKQLVDKISEAVSTWAEIKNKLRKGKHVNLSPDKFQNIYYRLNTLLNKTNQSWSTRSTYLNMSDRAKTRYRNAFQRTWDIVFSPNGMLATTDIRLAYGIRREMQQTKVDELIKNEEPMFNDLARIRDDFKNLSN